MIEVVSEIEILASPRRVWEALVDFPNYSKWNPNVAIRGVAARGVEVDWSFGRLLVQREIWASAVISECDEAGVLAWSFGVAWLFSLEERFSLQRVTDGTRLRHTAKCGGLIAALAGRLLRRRLTGVLTEADQGLCRYLNPQSERAPPPVRPTHRGGGRRKKKRRQSRSGRR